MLLAQDELGHKSKLANLLYDVNYIKLSLKLVIAFTVQHMSLVKSASILARTSEAKTAPTFEKVVKDLGIVIGQPSPH